ncbi:MAG: hypothetical protein IJB39_05580 [Alistipes sp.]|nr:hypothetical protein [Alistipes sp.]MBR2015108.1 hypothetical protein [Alistipes sp.]
MATDNHSPRSLMTAIVTFLFSIITATILLVVVLLEWLTSLIGSDLVATLIVAAMFLLAAAIIYLLSAHKAITQIKARWDEIYDVAYAARKGFERVRDFIRLFLG